MLGFYTTVWNSISDLGKQKLPSYIPDTNENSTLLNITHKTVHRLHDPQHAFAVSS